MTRSSLFLIALSLASCGGDAPHRPDVVVLLLDTTRADNLGPFAKQDPTPTPFFNRLAESSVVFENAWTASTWTAPSTASIFTGLLPPRHGVELNLWVQATENWKDDPSKKDVRQLDMVALPASVQTIPEHLSRAGYQTVCVGANLNVCKQIGFHRGFDHFNVVEDRDAEEMAAELRKITKKLDPDRPTYYFLHYMDPHAPYSQRRPWCSHPEDLEGCRPRCRYNSEVSYMDGELGRLFTEMGWPEDTIVMVVTDHGEEFREHGGVMHRYSVYQELSRSGMMLHAPGLEPRRTTQPAHHVDILPTLLEILDLPAPEVMDGVALVPTLDDALARTRPVVTHRVNQGAGKQLWALTHGKWRFIEELPTGEVELYDIAKDPREKHDLAAEEPELVAELKARLEGIRSGLEPIPRERVTVDLTDHLSEELIKMGYAGNDE